MSTEAVIKRRLGSGAAGDEKTLVVWVSTAAYGMKERAFPAQSSHLHSTVWTPWLAVMGYGGVLASALLAQVH